MRSSRRRRRGQTAELRGGHAGGHVGEGASSSVGLLLWLEAHVCMHTHMNMSLQPRGLHMHVSLHMQGHAEAHSAMQAHAEAHVVPHPGRRSSKDHGPRGTCLPLAAWTLLLSAGQPEHQHRLLLS